MAAIAAMLFSSGGGPSTPVAPVAPVAPADAAPPPAPPAAVSAAIASLAPQRTSETVDDGFRLPPEIDPPQGLYVMVPAGIDPADRRRTALAVAASLAPRGGRAAVFLLEGGVADAYVFGDPACGRTGREQGLDPADPGGAIRELLSQCDQVAVVPLEISRGLPRGLAGRVRRTVFVAAADAESFVETYRELKAWRARGLALPAALFVVGADGAAEAGRLAGRLRRASREFLGCDLANQGFLTSEAANLAAERPEPLRILDHTPLGEIWPRLLGEGDVQPADVVATRAAAAAIRAPAEARLPVQAGFVAPSAAAPQPPEKPRDSHLVFGGAAPLCARPCVSEATLPAAAKAAEKPGYCPSFLGARPAGARAAGAAGADACSVFSPWRPQGREELVAAIEAQPAAMLDPSLRQVIRVDVDEPGAPPLAAVRDDGTLVAILLAPGGEPADTRAAARWLTAHRRLLVRAYPHAGIREDAEPAAIVLAPMQPPPADGLRRYLPIQLGGRRGIVLLP